MRGYDVPEGYDTMFYDADDSLIWVDVVCGGGNGWLEGLREGRPTPARESHRCE